MKQFTFLFVACCLLFATKSKAQPSERFVVDTIMMEGTDSVVLFSDKTWEYLDIFNFDGVMNPVLEEYLAADTNYNYSMGWNNTVPFHNGNYTAGMYDTIWMCAVDSQNPNFCIPFDGPVISKFKYRGRRFHKGIDIDLDIGDSVYAAFDGRVRYAQYNDNGFGNLVIIRHYNGLETYYAHFSKLLVMPNQLVKAGDLIGLGGSTGRSTGPHLHFEVRFYHNALNPELIFDFENKTLQDENLLVNGSMFHYAKKSSSSSSSSSSSRSSSGVSSSVKVHKVRRGDSLYYIALKYGTTVDKLCSLNGIKRDSILHIGQNIKLK